MALPRVIVGVERFGVPGRDDEPPSFRMGVDGRDDKTSSGRNLGLVNYTIALLVTPYSPLAVMVYSHSQP